MSKVKVGDEYLVETYNGDGWAYRLGTVLAVKRRWWRFRPLIVWDVQGFTCDNTFGRNYVRISA